MKNNRVENTMTNPQTMMDIAILYAEHGWKVYPLVQGKRIPHKGSHGHLEASNNPEEVKTLFQKYDVQSNIALNLVDSDIVVLDIDLHHEDKSGFESLKDIEEAYNSLPDTFVVATPRKGEHRYYRVPGLSMNKDFTDFRPGLDILSTKVYAPPSIVTDDNGAVIGSYKVKNGKISEIADLPQWFFELIIQYEKRSDTGCKWDTDNNYKTPPQSKGKTIQLLEEVVQGIGEGSRNTFFTRAFGILLRANMGIEAAIKLMTDWNEQYVQPPLGQRELHSVLKSILNRENKKMRCNRDLNE